MGRVGGGLNKAFGLVVRGLRERARLSQEQLANLAGLHRTYISILERGARSPTLDTIVALARALRRSPHYLVRQAERAPRGPDR
jgi:transcriptional regulator with XRE-family HTH domain